MNKRKTRVLLLGVRYPHWGGSSGYAGFMDRLDPERFDPVLVRTPLGRDLFPSWLAWPGSLVRGWARRRGRKIVDLNDIVSEWRGLRTWLSQGIDVVHYLDGEHALLALPALGSVFRQTGRRTAFVASFHQPPDILPQLVTPEVVSGLHGVITVSPTQNDFFEQVASPPPVTTILHGIDVEFFRAEARQRDPDEPFVLLTVGRWLRDIEAVLTTARTMTDTAGVQFHLISPGRELGELPPNVKVSTGISDEALLRAYRESSALFLPLLDATANNALLEGMACGLPIISTDLASVRAYLGHEVEARLAKGNEPEEFARIIMELRSQPEVLQRMRASGLQRAETLNWQRTAPEYEAVYTAALAAARQG